MTPDPYAPHLRQADQLFAQGEVIKAGQIWQAILKQQPGHAEARERLVALRGYLQAQREAAAAAAPPAASPAPEPIPEPVPVTMAAPPPPTPAPIPPPGPAAPPAPAPASVPVPAPVLASMEPDRLLIEGCTLYDMGQVPDALQKWEQVLAIDPTHSLALGYANGARRELGLSPLQTSASAAPTEEPAPAAEEDVDKLLREAVQLYDMGLTEEAISKWEHVLVLEPHREEIQSYLRMARQELTLPGAQTSTQAPALPSAPTPAPGPAATPDEEALALKLRQAEHLLSLQRHDEAAFTYQQALQLAPGHPEALAGLERCRRPQASMSPTAHGITLDTRGPITLMEEDATLIMPSSAQVEPPASMTRTASAPREGISLPDRLQKASVNLPWLREPKVWAMTGGGILVLAGSLYALHTYRQDQELKEAVKAARQAAVAPVLQQAQSPDLSETPAAILHEGERILDRDPLRAYFRAQTVLAQNPGDAAAAQLLEKARAALPGGATGASLLEFQKHLQDGDLDAAAKVMDALLRAQPDDPGLRSRAARLYLTLCGAHAGQAKWDEAAEDLRQGRAISPSDKSWQARLKLLERLKTLPKSQQAAWLPLLG
ncbi:hypothetical protein [Geothrix fuzhouensis]|uniref:hypothetical protein n=1 Tax=Geothrix fuzhouensis TaxID=2966451 RepID=UPI0027D2E1D2|nr:hypothetical protein [Geothrix fuzhouensis]